MITLRMSSKLPYRNNEKYNTCFSKIYISLFVSKGDWNFCRERVREAEANRDKGALEHCYIDPYLDLCHVTPNLELYQVLLKSAVPHSDSGPYVFSSLTRHSQTVFTGGRGNYLFAATLGLQDSTLQDSTLLTEDSTEDCWRLPQPLDGTWRPLSVTDRMSSGYQSETDCNAACTCVYKIS